MSAVAFSKRRAMLRAIGCGVAVSGLPVALAQGSAGVDGPSPHRLPLATVDDLEIAQPAELDGEAVDLAVLALGILDLPSGQFVGVDGLLLEGAAYVPSVAPGRYPVQIVLARAPGGDEGKPPFAASRGGSLRPEWRTASFGAGTWPAVRQAGGLSGEDRQGLGMARRPNRRR